MKEKSRFKDSGQKLREMKAGRGERI